MWANQFEAFCAPPNGKYYCIAPSWFDFHPDVPARSEGDLRWDKQVDAFHTVATQMGLKNITLVIFDFGAVMGYIYAYRFPHMVTPSIVPSIA